MSGNVGIPGAGQAGSGQIGLVVPPSTSAPYGGSTFNIPKLDGKNYQSWVEIVSIVLKLRGLDRAIVDDRDEVGNLQAKLVLLESMDESHRSQVRGCASAKDILARLELVYADRSAANIYRLLHKYYRYEKLESDTMSQHIGRMDEMRNTLADLGEKQSDRLYQVALIGSLPEEYQTMMEVWELTHPDMRTTPNLVARLLKKEEDIKLNQDRALLVGGKGNAKEWNSLTIAEKKKISKCKRCNQIGHWAKECTNPTATGPETKKKNTAKEKEKEKEDAKEALNVLFNLGTIRNSLKDKWIADTGASNHMCNKLNWFSEYKAYDQPKTVSVGDGSEVAVMGVGNVKIVANIEGQRVNGTLTNVRYIPVIATNLISIGAASKQGIVATFEKSKCKLSKNGVVVLVGHRLTDNLYEVDMNAAAKDQDAALLMKGEHTLDEWHRILGHAGKDKVVELIKDEGLGLKIIPGGNDACSACPMGKGKHVPHPPSGGTRAESVGEKVHMDLVSICNKDSLYNYYLLCKDEASEFTFVYMLKSKSETAMSIAKFIADFEIGSGQSVRTIHSDNGSEFVNKNVQLVLAKERIVHTTSAPYQPQQNGIAEREVQTISNMARTMLIQSKLPSSVLPVAIQTASYLKNRLPTSRSQLTPFERFTGRKPQMRHLVEFGREVQILENGHYLTKFEPKTIPAYVVGFTNRVNTYQVFVPSTNKVVTTCDVFFQPHAKIDNDSGTQLGGVQISAEVYNPQHIRSNGDEQGLFESDPDSNRQDTSHDNRRVGKNGKPYLEGEDLAKWFEENRAANAENNASNVTDNDEVPPATPRRCSSLKSSRVPQTSTPLSETIKSDMEKVDKWETANESRLEEMTLTESAPKMLSMCSSLSDEPQTYKEAISGPNSTQWAKAIAEELEAHDSNGTWQVVDRPKKANTLSAKWVFVIKRDQMGNVERFKARLVARGFEQRYGIDYVDTFAPVVRAESVRLLLSVCAIKRYHMRQFDIATAFLNGELKEEVYIDAPQGVTLETDKCLKLSKALYGLKQSPKCWNSKFDQVVKSLGFNSMANDRCVYANLKLDLIMLVYVDDGLIFGKTEASCDWLISELNKHFVTKLVKTNRFLGMEIIKKENSIWVGQRLYASDLLERHRMNESTPMSTPIADVKTLLLHDESPKAKGEYRQILGGIQYCASKTRPDLLFPVNLLSRFNSDFKEIHLTAAKRLLRYLKGTGNTGIEYRGDNIVIQAFSDADWGNDKDNCASVSGIMITVGGGPVVFASRKQGDIALSSTEAEYIAAGETTKELAWMCQLLRELGIDFDTPTLFVDNQSAIRHIKNQDTSKFMKHVKIKYHYVRQAFEEQLFTIKYISTHDQPADILTKCINGPKLRKILQQIQVKQEENNDPTEDSRIPCSQGTSAAVDC